MVVKISKLFRPGICTGLVIALLCLSACAVQEDKSTDSPGITLLWKDRKAIGISIPHELTAHFSKDSLSSLLAVKLEGNRQQPRMLGRYEFQENALIFKPLIPFTQGLRYDIFLDSVFLKSVLIPQLESVEKPALIAIYPTADTLPENLLKMYLRFSKPMAAGNSLRFVSLLNNYGDTLQAPFLALQPELWNQAGTQLTLWLDPGRIKKDLQPNKALGPPLVQGETVTLIVSPRWKAQNGLSLESTFTKQFFVGSADKTSPAPESWKLEIPTVATRQPLAISFGEPLDYSLLKETITIHNSDEETVLGKIGMVENEKQLLFVPDRVWATGQYDVLIASILEDLAGNNLHRLFEVDNENAQPVRDQKYYKLDFEIR